MLNFANNKIGNNAFAYNTLSYKPADDKEYSNLLRQMTAKNVPWEIFYTPIFEVPAFANNVSAYLTESRDYSLNDLIEKYMNEPDYAFFVKDCHDKIIGYLLLEPGSWYGKPGIKGIELWPLGNNNTLLYDNLAPVLEAVLKNYAYVTWRSSKGDRAYQAYRAVTKKMYGIVCETHNSTTYTFIKDAIIKCHQGIKYITEKGEHLTCC